MDIGLLYNAIDIVFDPKEVLEDTVMKAIGNKGQIAERVQSDGYVGITIRGSYQTLYTIMWELTNVVIGTGIEIY